MKVIIVGGGIAGLSTWLFLKKYCADLVPLELTIYESHQPGEAKALAETTFQELSSSSLSVGGGLGLSPNGMRILRELDLSTYERVKQCGFVAEKFVFKSARGWRLNSTDTSDNRGKDGFPQGGEESCLSISRHRLWESILETVGQDKLVYKKVVKVTAATRNTKAFVQLEDGTKVEADLVIGADGVRSEVLRGIFPNEDKIKPKYEGLLGVGGFINDRVPDEILQEKSMVFTFGSNGFFGYSASNVDEIMWWSTCQAEDIPAERKISPDEMRKQLQERHGKWKDPIIQDIISKTNVEQIYPVWIIENLPSYGHDGLVVIGDAAHALHPTSGQGASQALEDAKCLALLLSKFLGTKATEKAIERTISAFYEIRSPRLQKIAERTKMMAQSKKDQNIVEEMMVCFMLWLIGKAPSVGKAMIGDVNKELYYWDMEGLVDAAVKKRTSTSLQLS